MKKLIFLLSSAFILISCQNQQKDGKLSGRNINFNEDWRFSEDSAISASDADYDDSGWPTVDLPHDWSVEDQSVQDSVHSGPFYTAMENGNQTGFMRGGTGWYRKTFTLDKENEGKQVYLYFDGVQTESTVYVNGEEVGNNVYGYTPFYFNISRYLNRPGEANTIAVKVVNPEQNSRWFTGSGIYRDVTLSVVDPVHVAPWGISVSTAGISNEAARLNVSVNIQNEKEEASSPVIKTEILDPEGTVVSTKEEELQISGMNSAGIDLSIDVSNPQLWSPDSPDMYKAVITLQQNNEVIDRYEQPFGIRTTEFSADRGFLLNKQPVLLKGGCVHHDNGLIGAAAFKEAEYRRVKILKDNGYNAIRCAHNPPSAQFLNACDELGMLVIDETFDMWIKPKRPNDYHRHYSDWWEKDTRAMVMRDRNHPSVIIWSVGNEVQERADSSGLVIAKAAYDLIKSIDSTRPVTQAVCRFWDNPGKEWDENAATFAQMDIGGYNYQHNHYESDHEKYPERIMFGSESVPGQAIDNWRLVEKHPYVIGDFVWTAMDYVGEATIGKSAYRKDKNANLEFHETWPYYQANCGDIDLTGNKKPQSYFRDVMWGESNLEMAVHEPVPEGMQEVVFFWGWPREYQSWNWQGQEGEELTVNVYSSWPEVKLSLNGKEIGTRETDSLTATFKVPYQPGELTVTGIRDGEEMESKTFKTTGKPAKITLTPEKSRAGEIAYLQLAITDEEGNRIPMDSSLVNIKVSGEGKLLAAGNASPFADGSLQDEQTRLFNGRALVVIRSTGKKGTVKITAESEGVEGDEVELVVGDCSNKSSS